MNKLNLSKLLVVILSVFLLSNCTDNEESIPLFLEVTSSVTFNASGESKEVTVSTNATDWSFNLDDVTSEWVKVTKVSSGDSNKLLITVESNLNNSKRSSLIRLSGGGINKQIRIEQLGSDNAILISESRITVPALGGDIMFEVTSNIEYEIIIPDSVSWIIPIDESKARSSESVTKDHYFKIEWSGWPRNTEITVKHRGGELSSRVYIDQKGQEEYVVDKIDIDTDDVKIGVKNAKSSSSMKGAEIDKSFDGDIKTIYHSEIDNSGGSYFPIMLDYYFDKNDQVDYFIYKPRQDNNKNGNFKLVDIYLSTKSENEFVKYKEYDFKGISNPTKINFDDIIEKPKAIRFVVKSGEGPGQGYASCAEMEFYQINPDSFNPNTIFTDKTYSELLPGISEKDILAINSTFYKNLAYHLYTGKYPKEFRVQDYKAWANPDKFAKENKISPYSLLDNPTGIRINSGDELIAFVGNTHGYSNLRIKIQNLDLPGGDGYNDNSSFFQLQEGTNRIKADRSGLIYVMYHSDSHKVDPPIKIHFATGEVNGYFDSQKHKKEDWSRILNSSTDKFLDVLGEYSHLTFPVANFKSSTPDGLELIQTYDKLVYWEQDFMGLYKFNRIPGNRLYFHISYRDNWYMYATSYRTAYVERTMATVMCDVKKFKQNCWGPAHEVGHIHQTRPGFKWHAMTEVSNNVHSLYVQRSFGFPSKLMEKTDGFNSIYEKALKTFFVDNSTHPEGGGDVFCKLVPLWQLFLYFDATGDSDFYKKLYEEVRIRPDKLSEGERQLEFVKIASQAAKKDLTDYFKRWGFLTPLSRTVYAHNGTGKMFVVTQSQVNNIITQIKSYNYPKPDYAIDYVDDANWEFIKNRSELIKGTAVQSGSKVTMYNWKNVMAYEVWENDKLIFVSNSSSFSIGKSITSNMNVLAIDYKGEKHKVSF